MEGVGGRREVDERVTRYQLLEDYAQILGGKDVVSHLCA